MRTRQSLDRKSRKDGSLERHHIRPKCLGGTNAKENLVYLTPREHFLAHLLLVRFLTGKPKAQMSFALLMMTRNNPNQTRIVSSWQYAVVKKAISENCRGSNHPAFGLRKTEAQKKVISERMSGPNNPHYGQISWNHGLTADTSPILRRAGEKYSLYVKENPSVLQGRSHTEETRQKISRGHLGKTKSEDHLQKISLALKGRSPTREAIEKSALLHRGVSQETLVCPKCLKSGGTVAMRRWHFEFCGIRKPISEETREKMRRAARLRVRA
jgi:hypothetical protein